MANPVQSHHASGPAAANRLGASEPLDLGPVPAPRRVDRLATAVRGWRRLGRPRVSRSAPNGGAAPTRRRPRYSRLGHLGSWGGRGRDDMALGAPALTLPYAPPISRNRVYAWNGGCDREPGDACLASRRGPTHEALPLH